MTSKTIPTTEIKAIREIALRRHFNQFFYTHDKIQIRINEAMSEILCQVIYYIPLEKIVAIPRGAIY